MSGTQKIEKSPVQIRKGAASDARYTLPLDNEQSNTENSVVQPATGVKKHSEPLRSLGVTQVSE